MTMRRPERQFDQYHGKALAEITRGCGVWPLQPHPVDLEPPWEPFDRHNVSSWDCFVNGWEASWEPSWLKRQLVPERRVLAANEQLVLPPSEHAECGGLVTVAIEQFAEDQTTIPRTDQFLRTLSNVRHPVSFELIGVGALPQYDNDRFLECLRKRKAGISCELASAIVGWEEPYVQAQFVAHPIDAKRIERQLLSHYPNSAVVSVKDAQLSHVVHPLNCLNECEGYAGTLSLSSAYCMPLRTFNRLDPDPLGVAIAAMDRIGRDDCALLQILFQPTRYPWDQTLDAAIADPYTGDLMIPDLNQRMLNEKFGSPLFAVSVRIVAKRESVYRHLQGWAKQFARSPQSFDFLLDDDEADSLWNAVYNRCAYRPGMLLNTEELSSLVHLPSESVVSERLRRVKTRTRPAVPSKQERGVVALGENVHQGKRRLARIPAALRLRHTYLAGASGTGKSTLLMNMILQDMTNGEGVALLDPHGDLVHDVLKRIPSHRLDDVILFDPTDQEYPFALNILEARDSHERERIVAETLMALERYFPASWGPRLERILTFTLYTVLETIPGATLRDVERMLTDHQFRDQIVQRTKNSRYVDFWDNEFRFVGKNAVDPVLNKISVFLINPTVRNIICQRHSALDFDHLLNNGKILLANLSTGLLSERLSGMFGSFLTTKIVNAAFRRAGIPEEQRRPFYLYVDEFQSFMNLSVGFDRILVGARKYKLVLAGLANQYVGQLTPIVRQAIFGNVGTLISFRLGIDDARLLEKELGVFTANEILNLKVGEAIVRAEITSQSFNVSTFPPQPVAGNDPTNAIRARSRARFAKPRSDVESQWDQSEQKPKPQPESNEAPEWMKKSKRKRRGKKGKPVSQRSNPQESESRQSDLEHRETPRDPSEDDLVN